MSSADHQIPATEADGEIDERWIAVLDAALKVQAPLARSYVASLRRKKPEASDAELMRTVLKRFAAVATATGAGIGGTAALPGLGTAVAVGLTIGEGASFAESAAFAALAVAEIRGVDMSDPSARRLVLMAVLSGERGAGIIAKSLGKQGMQWSSLLSGGGGMVPELVTRQVSRYVKRRVLARTSTVWLGRLLPFGVGAVIGGVGARAAARSVVEALEEIFSFSAVIDGGLAPGAPEIESEGE